MLIPRFDYMGSAWATFSCYCCMMVASYFLGQKYYHVDYNVKKVLFYILLAVGVYGLSVLINSGLNVERMSVRLAVNSVILVVYLTALVVMNRNYLRSIMRKSA